MKVYFAEVKGQMDVSDLARHFNALPQKVCITSTIQFLHYLDEVEELLQKAGKEVNRIKGLHTRYQGQLLGCSYSRLNYDNDTETFLFIGDGMFHPESLYLETKKDVHVYDPFAKRFFLLDKANAQKSANYQKVALTKFLHAMKVGVLLTVKPGQMELRRAYALEEKFPDKEFYFMAFNTLNFTQLDNFPFIQVFVNTACSRIGIDDFRKFSKPVVNLDEVEKLSLPQVVVK